MQRVYGARKSQLTFPRPILLALRRSLVSLLAGYLLDWIMYIIAKKGF